MHENNNGVQAKFEEHRRSPRLSAAIQVEISGMDLTGEFFAEVTMTQSVNRHGGTICLHRRLVPDQEITVRCCGAQTEADARIVGQVAVGERGRVYGIELLGIENIWGIEFPPTPEARKAEFLLSCCACAHRQLVKLSELELRAFQANMSISRACVSCNKVTVWNLTLHDSPSKKGNHTPTVVPVAPRQERRHHSRIHIKLKARLFQPPPGGEDSIKLVDVSRGGMRFRSIRAYLVGEWVHAAVPYTPMAENFFIPARIIWRGPTTDAREYGLAYVRPAMVRIK